MANDPTPGTRPNDRGGSQGGGVPTVVIKPSQPKSRGPASQPSALQALDRQSGGRYHDYIPAIKNAATRWGVDPSFVLATMIWEGGQATVQPNSAGAIGLAQIVDRHVDKSLNPEQFASFKQQFGEDITPAMAADPSFAINYLSWRMAGGISKYGSLNAWYSGGGGNGKPRGYNPGFAGDGRGKGPADLFKKAGVGSYQGSIPPTPRQTVGKGLDVSNVKKSLTDPWVTLKKEGDHYTIAKSTSLDPPKNVLTYGGAPLTKSTYIQAWNQTYSDTFNAYTGRAPKAKEIADILSHAPSQYTLANTLAQKVGFVKSPVFKAHAPGLLEYARTIMGNGWKPPKGFISKAIAQNWDQATLTANLRQRPEYLQSNEFQSKSASLSNIFQSVYGTGDTNDSKTAIKEAALAGWSDDQFALWLRSRPEYSHSNEFQQRLLDFQTKVGLVTGQVPTLSAKNPAPNGTGQPSSPALPNSQRIAGAGGVTPSNNLNVGFAA